jgi:hypothetical protein
VGRGEKSSNWGGKRWKKLELLKRVVTRIEKSCDRLRSGGHTWKGLSQDEDEFTEVRLRPNSYRQTLSLHPIVSHSLNLETSAIRLAPCAGSTCIYLDIYCWIWCKIK